MLYPPKPRSGGAPTGGLFARLWNDPAYLCQFKEDGERRLVWAGPNPSSMTRTGLPADLAPAVRARLACCPYSIRLDVEEMEDGRLWVHDAPGVAGMMDVRLAAVLRALRDMYEGHVGGRMVLAMPEPDVWLNADEAWMQAMDAGAEGVVFKRIGAEYDWATRPGGTTNDWIKFKEDR